MKRSNPFPQTTLAVSGETYTFAGCSRFEEDFTGDFTTVSTSSPSGAVASSALSSFQTEYLDAVRSVLGTLISLDIAAEQTNDSQCRPSTLSGAAPVCASRVRVTASVADILFNTGPGQSGFHHNFSLTAGIAPASELLTNAVSMNQLVR